MGLSNGMLAVLACLATYFYLSTGDPTEVQTDLLVRVGMITVVFFVFLTIFRWGEGALGRTNDGQKGRFGAWLDVVGVIGMAVCIWVLAFPSFRVFGVEVPGQVGDLRHEASLVAIVILLVAIFLRDLGGGALSGARASRPFSRKRSFRTSLSPEEA